MNEQERKAWLGARKGLVGASEVAALFGLDPYGKTIQQLYDEKVAEVDAVDGVENPDQERGRYLEPIILEIYQRKTGRQVIPIGLQVNPDEPHMGATPDGQIVLSEKPTAEVKSVRGPKFYRMRDRGLSDGWILQVQAQLEVCRAPWGAFIFHTADAWDMTHFDIERDADVGAALRAKIHEFWQYVENRQRPEKPLKYDDLPTLTGVAGQVIMRGDQLFADVVGRLIEAKQIKKSAEEIEDLAKTDVRDMLAGQYGSFEGGGYRIHYKQRAGRNTFDPDTLAGAVPLDPIKVASVIANSGLIEGDSLKQLLANLAAEARLDLSQFYNQGAPYAEIRTYVLKSEADEAERLPAPKLRLAKGSE